MKRFIYDGYMNAVVFGISIGWALHADAVGDMRLLASMIILGAINAVIAILLVRL